ncbi:class I adenylate-forming enzyme family protein [Amycolatopsis sp. FDAARGOS 1241]|uniref:class I adenylate-forming enzyme family protein n=1 Tax=Amycolatopsis sp. FDAARGOS 1241 TaxID=2778070 RepID=UPI001950EE3B|nr:AMP-binding protein [Amycolatopsis sp. FDAARGOS 1241]QRP42949.1 AMP-binding protein [Amycolatopsis sp. FDAARGOS 1241]
MTADTLAARFVEVAGAHAAREALVDGTVRITHQQALRRSTAVAVRLLARGVAAGDRVAILLPNGWQFAIGYCGAQLAGAIVVLVNTRLTEPELEHILTDSGATVIITDAALGARVPAALADRIVAADLLTAEPRVAEDADPATLPGHTRAPHDVAHLLYTSGTTGRPKGAMHTHANLLFNTRTVRERLGAAADERTLIAAPMFHATATVSQFIGFFTAGACCVFTPAFKAETAVALMTRERVTFFAGVAAMLKLILLKAADSAADLSALRLFVLGGSAVPEGFPAEVARRLPGLTLGNVWGLTEGTSIVTYTEGEEYLAHTGTAGKPVTGVEVAIALDGGRPRDVRDTVGELCVRGPVVAGGYWNAREATAATFVDGWLHTGDVGCVDADGFVRVLDRLKDMIIRGGENIYSLEVENVLATHPDVAEVAVVGVPDPIFDERVRAVVVPRPGRTPSVESLRTHAAGSLADYKVPAEIHFVEELPRNPSGKVLKRRLVADAVPSAKEFDDVRG